MRGRAISYRLLTFSFKEYLKVKNVPIEKYLSSYEKAKIINFMRTYLEYGGYPEVIIHELEREKILNEIHDTVIYQYVIERNKVRNVKAMKLLISALINSKEFSVNKFYNFLKSTGVKVGKNVLYN